VACASFGLTMTNADNARILEELTAAISAGKPVTLATIVATRRSVPRHAGAKMLVYADGSTVGTVGGGEMESRVVAEAIAALHRGSPRTLDYELVNPADGDPGICGGELTLYLEPYMPPHNIYVIGCGHVGRAVIDLAHWLGYHTIAIDDRPDLVTETAVPNADVRFAGSVDDAVAAHPVSEDSSIIVVTRSPEVDVRILPGLVETPARYIGVMGSRKRWRATYDQLAEKGIDVEKLDRLHVPIGIDLNAETLEEIAVSIMAEVIRNNRAGTS
jgi:xanthine dehydrogenase accessory factor